MAIRQIVSRSIKDGEVAGSDMATGAAAGFFQGDNGNSGNTSTGKKDISRSINSHLSLVLYKRRLLFLHHNLLII